MPALQQIAAETGTVLACLAIVVAGSMLVAAVLWRVWPFYRRLIRMDEGAVDEGARPSDGSTRFEQLDGLRGVLCLMVVVHHAIITLALPAGRGDWGAAFRLSRPYMRLNAVAVALFFCVTAFLFYRRAVVNAATGRPVIDVRRFFVQRVMRIAPAVLLSGVLIFTLDALTERRYTLRDPGALWTMLLRILTLGATGGGKDVVYNAGVMWTLGFEWMFYLAFPLLAAACAAGVLPTVRILAWVGIAGLSAGGFGGTIALTFTPGLIAVDVLSRWPGFRRFARSSAGSAVAMLALVLTIAAARSTFADAALLVGLTVMFPLFAGGCDLFGLLRLGSLRAIGVASFSVYLLHGIVLYLARPLLAQAGSLRSDDTSLALASMAAAGATTTVISFITFRWIEHPGIELGRRLTRARPT
jgi:peptidoglycan/LPS O-acetylase OafA/YrhL